jgi:hypothetical protein
MAIELSNLTFTDQDDVVPASGVEEILNTGVANILAGNDTITSINTNFNIVSYPLFTIGTTGFYNSGTLNTSDGNDIVTGIHDPNEPPSSNVSNIRSYGLFNEEGRIDTGEGNDIITGISKLNKRNSGGIYNALRADGIASSNGSTINTGDGNDTIIGTSEDIAIFNAYDSIIDTGKGNDITIGTGRVGIENFYSTIDTGDGNDIITGTGDDLFSIGILNFGLISSGNDNDTITGTTFNFGSGIDNSSNGTIDTGDGDDIITAIGNSNAIYNQGLIFNGNGHDSIISDGMFANYGGVFLGDGNDSIINNADSSNRGINNVNMIETGNGNDIIISTGIIYNEGTINTGDGEDSIIAGGGFDVTDYNGINPIGHVFLGNGRDYIKGFGIGDYYGGNGNDTLELTPGTYTVGIWGEAGESPIFTKGNQLMITSEFEKLKAGNQIYDFNSLTAGQIIIVA